MNKKEQELMNEFIVLALNKMDIESVTWRDTEYKVNDGNNDFCDGLITHSEHMLNHLLLNNQNDGKREWIKDDQGINPSLMMFFLIESIQVAKSKSKTRHLNLNELSIIENTYMLEDIMLSISNKIQSDAFNIDNIKRRDETSLTALRAGKMQAFSILSSLNTADLSSTQKKLLFGKNSDDELATHISQHIKKNTDELLTKWNVNQDAMPFMVSQISESIVRTYASAIKSEYHLLKSQAHEMTEEEKSNLLQVASQIDEGYLLYKTNVTVNNIVNKVTSVDPEIVNELS